MKLIVISSETVVRSEVAIINSLFAEGMELFHLRKPWYSAETVKKLMGGIEEKYHEKIALHLNHELADELGTKRLHYPERFIQESDAEKWQKQKDAGYLLSTSIHSLGTLSQRACFEYVFFGPVFDSISKPGYYTTLNKEFSVAKTSEKPEVIALGGVKPTNLAMAKAMGFDGAGVLGYVWQTPGKALEKFKRLQKSLLV